MSIYGGANCLNYLILRAIRAMYGSDQTGGETMARITKIEATRTSLERMISVAAYDRVSTDSDEL